MADPLVVLFLVVADPADPTTIAMTAATRRSLGAEAMVLVEERQVLPSDRETVTLGAKLRADAVVGVRWVEPDHRRVWFRLHLAADGSWQEREIAFDARDELSERGRAIGLAVSSMIPHAEPSAPPPVPEPPPPPAPKPAPRPPTKPPPPPAPPSRSAVAPPARLRVVLEGFASGSVGLGGPATGLGPGIAGRLRLRDGTEIRLGGAMRFGELAPADASASTTILSGGLAWHVKAGTSFEFGARADLLVVRHSFRRPDASGDRWISGADLLLETSWWPAASFGVGASVGMEAVFGTTTVRVRGRDTAEVPPLRAIAELGFRARF